MYRFILIFTAMVLCGGHSPAQRNLAGTDTLTWQLYKDNQWEQLLDEADQAFKNGFDFYYLRVRAGVAAYTLKKFRESAHHFQIAYQDNKTDDFLNGYYYWALKMAGRDDEAVYLADQQTTDFLHLHQIARKGTVNGITAESLLSFNDDYNNLLSENFETQGSFSNYRSLLRRQVYEGLGLDHHMAPRLNLYQGFSHIGTERTQLYLSTLNLLDTVKESSTCQLQYYIHGRYLLGRGWSLSAAYTRLWGNGFYHVPVYLAPDLYNLVENKWKIDDYVICAGITREFILFRPKLEIGFGSIDGYNQFQTNLQAAFYPFGNLSFFLVPEGSLHWDGSSGDFRMVYNQKIGFQTGPVWVTGEFAFGRMKNFFSAGGLVVYNMPESNLGKAGITFWAPLLRYKLGLAVRYLLSVKEGMTFVYENASDFQSKPYRFNEQSFLISLKWNL